MGEIKKGQTGKTACVGGEKGGGQGYYSSAHCRQGRYYDRERTSSEAGKIVYGENSFGIISHGFTSVCDLCLHNIYYIAKRRLYQVQ